jgi:hypothetical protein
MAVMEGTEVALEHMSLEKGGRGGLIVNTASLAGIGAFPIPKAFVVTCCLLSFRKGTWVSHGS